MNAISQVIRLLALAMLTSTVFAGPPDFSVCGGSTGVSKGLCRAGIAVGCDQEASTACQKIGEQYTAKTGNEPPWSDRTILIYAESTVTTGEKQPIDGTWEFPCFQGSNPDETARYFFLGDIFEVQILNYTSTDGSCSSGETITTRFEGTVVAFDDFITDGWSDGTNLVPPPDRMDGSGGSLDPNPTVTKLELTIPAGRPEAGTRRMFFYMDDTAPIWYLYGEGEDDSATYSSLVGNWDPRKKLP